MPRKRERVIVGPFLFRWLRILYEWVLKWAYTRHAESALILVAFVESSFFPVPPDVLLVAMGLSKPKKGIRWGVLCTIFSVLGGALGYVIGLKLMQVIGYPILEMYDYTASFEKVQAIFQEWDVWAIFVAGLTPIPYKVFTIAAGACEINFWSFILASIVGRGLRFITIGILIRIYGPRVRDFIDKYFNFVVILFAILLIGGFVVVKYLL
ncbi:YqaA family protein [Bdellovibrionota bacterium]